MLEESPRSWIDTWALCRRDHGLTWDEFQSITLAQLEALEERRAIQIRHARHDASFIVATLFNLQRGDSAEVLSPFDFLPGFERDPDEVEAEKIRKETIADIRRTFTRMRGATMERVQEVRRKILDTLRERGFDRPEEIITEAFPNL